MSRDGIVVLARYDRNRLRGLRMVFRLFARSPATDGWSNKLWEGDDPFGRPFGHTNCAAHRKLSSLATMISRGSASVVIANGARRPIGGRRVGTADCALREDCQIGRRPSPNWKSSGPPRPPGHFDLQRQVRGACVASGRELLAKLTDWGPGFRPLPRPSPESSASASFSVEAEDSIDERSIECSFAAW